MRDKFVPAQFVEVAVENIKRAVINNNFQGAVLGVSGGIDSTVVAILCINALKVVKKRVVGLLLIDKSVKYEKYNAEILKQTGLEFICKDITSILQKEERAIGLPPRWLVLMFFRLFSRLPRPIFERIYLWVRTPPLPGFLSRCYQVLALPHRVRLRILEEFAKEHNLLKVICTNLSERLTGYFVEGGIDDLRCGDLAPISSLLKSEVYELANYLQIPQEILEQKPSPGFGGIYDEQILGPYPLLDHILSGRELNEFNQVTPPSHKGKSFMCQRYVMFVKGLRQLSFEK